MSWRFIAGALAVLGAFGLIQIRVVELSLKGETLALVLAAILVLAIIGSYVIRRRMIALPGTVGNLRHNKTRSKRAYEIVQKKCEARIAEGTSLRQDVQFRWTMRIRNRKRNDLGAIDLVLLGEVPAFDEDLIVYVEAEGEQERFNVPVDRQDRLAPTISIPLPVPGLSPGNEAEFSFEYEWPGVAHLAQDTWVFDVARMCEGGVLDVVLDYPASHLQVAEARVIRRRLGLDKSMKIGRLPGRKDEAQGRFSLKLDYRVRRHDDLLLVFTRSARSTSKGRTSSTQHGGGLA